MQPCLAATEIVNNIDLIKEKETIKQIKTKGNWFMGTTPIETYTYKLTKYKIINNTENTYKIIETKNFDYNAPLNYKELNDEIGSLDTLITFFFTLYCPLLAPYFAYYMVKDIVTAPQHIYKNKKRKTAYKRAIKSIIGENINKNSTLTFYTINNMNIANNEIIIILENIDTQEKQTITGNITPLKKENKTEKINKSNNQIRQK